MNNIARLVLFQSTLSTFCVSQTDSILITHTENRHRFDRNAQESADNAEPNLGFESLLTVS